MSEGKNIDMGITEKDFPTKGYTYNELAEGLQTIENSIMPSVEKGMGREEIRDAFGDKGVNLYDAYYGGKRIKIGMDKNGQMDVINGRHRLWVAKREGISRLPAEVKGET